MTKSHAEEPTILISRFDVTSDLDCLDQAIALLRGNVNRDAELRDANYNLDVFMLTEALKKHYDYMGDGVSLDECIQLHRKALTNLPPSEPIYASHISGLGLALYCSHYERSGDIASLHESISLGRQALEITSDTDPRRPTFLVALAHSLFVLHLIEGDDGILSEAMSLGRTALELSALDANRRSASLTTLGNLLSFHHRRSGDIEAINESIDVQREALRLRPPGYPLRLKTLNNLAASLFSCATRTNQIEYLVEANQLLREALQLTPKEHFMRKGMLLNLGSTLLLQFKTTQDVNLLDEAIKSYRDCLELLQRGDPRRIHCIANIGMGLHFLFVYFGDEDAPMQSIDLLREELRDYKEGNNDQRRTGTVTLAYLLYDAYIIKNDESTLQEAISLYHELIGMYSPGHVDLPSHTAELAQAVSAYSEHTNSYTLCTEAIGYYRDALALYAPESPYRPNTLNELGATLQRAYEHTKDSEFLEEALRCHHLALTLYPSGDPRIYETHHLIARVFLRSSPLFSWDQAMSHFAQASMDCNPMARKAFKLLSESIKMVESVLARESEPSPNSAEKTVDLYSSAINLLPRAANYGLDARSRLRELAGAEQLCRSASARAFLLGRTPLALELLEEGKAVFWTNTLRMRETAFNVLPGEDRDVLLPLLQKLDAGAQSASFATDRTKLEKLVSERRRMNDEAEKMIDEIRSRPGLERFLKLPSFSDLSQAAYRGIVVVLVASALGCFAHVITRPAETVSIPLTQVTPSTMKTMIVGIQSSNMRDRRDGNIDESDGTDRLSMRKQRNGPDSAALTVLASIWTQIVRPIFSSLNLTRSSGRSRPRIHWCPTGEFTSLPLHAAGLYEGPNRACVSDYAISSYTPSLSILIKSQRAFKPVTCANTRTLLIAEANAPGLPPLPKVIEEISCIKDIFSGVATIINDITVPAAEESVLKHLPTAHILHLACHGQQLPNPLDSRFVLKDSQLTISALMNLNLPDAVLAFLSACETAKGDTNQPDQAVHLAASMLFCGFRSVIATMWSMNDADGPSVARRVYETLLSKDNIDVDDIPYALDDAVQSLRSAGVSPARWATFIHMGA